MEEDRKFEDYNKQEGVELVSWKACPWLLEHRPHVSHPVELKFYIALKIKGFSTYGCLDKKIETPIIWSRKGLCGKDY